MTANLTPLIASWILEGWAIWVYWQSRNDDWLFLCAWIILLALPFHIAYRMSFAIGVITERGRREEWSLATLPPAYAFKRHFFPSIPWLLLPLSTLAPPIYRIIIVASGLEINFILGSIFCAFAGIALLFAFLLDGCAIRMIDSSGKTAFLNRIALGIAACIAATLLPPLLGGILKIPSAPSLFALALGVMASCALWAAYDRCLKAIYVFE